MKKFISGFLVGALLFSFSSFIFADNGSQSLASKIYQNAMGDIFKVFNKNDQLQVKLGSASNAGGNVGGTLILYNNNESKPRVTSSVSKTTDSGMLALYGKDNIARLLISGQQKDSQSGLFLYNSNGTCVTAIRENYGFINNQPIVTQDELVQEISKLQKQIDELKKQGK